MGEYGRYKVTQSGATTIGIVLLHLTSHRIVIAQVWCCGHFTTLNTAGLGLGFWAINALELCKLVGNRCLQFTLHGGPICQLGLYCTYIVLSRLVMMTADAA